MSNISLVPQELLHLEECIFEGMRRDYREYGDCDGFRKRFQESIIHAEDLSFVIFDGDSSHQVYFTPDEESASVFVDKLKDKLERFQNE